jgi:hypothetical protein
MIDTIEMPVNAKPEIKKKYSQKYQNDQLENKN